MSASILPQGKHVERDPLTGDYAVYYDGQLLGYRATRPAAEELANQYVWAQLTKGVAVPAGEPGRPAIITCIRCRQPTAPEDMYPHRRHCRACQRRADRISYYRNRFAKLEKVSRRRAEQYGCPIAEVDYAQIYADQIGQPCALCGEYIQPENYEFDHIWPLADGGAHSQQNVRLVHRQCNRAASMRRFILSRVLNRLI
jgi:5-methylcytosine-specific restriction endonuclease McrA